MDCCRIREDSDLSFHGSGDIQDEQTSLIWSDTDRHRTPVKDYESLDYDCCYNEAFAEMLAKHSEDKWFERKLEIVRWIVTFLIGFLTAMVALFIDQIVKLLSEWKFSTVDASIRRCSEEGCLGISLLLFLAFNVAFVTIAAMITSFVPVAAGSGIPEIKCYLNGVKVPQVVRLRTLVAKATGVLFSVAGGLFVGKEGPMIHSGAVIGAGVPQFQSIAFNKFNLKIPFFRSDREKRDFVSSGSAAGVAAAFGAPIGGVLFSLEEGSSFWNQKLTWRTFFCSMSATFSLNFFLSGLDLGGWGYFYQPGLINFGVFKCNNTSEECGLWTATDLGIFILMGIGGGLLGALFNSLNMTLTRCRMKYLPYKHWTMRVLEVILVATVTTSVAFLAAMTLGQCKRLPDTTTTQNSSSILSVRTYFCKDGYYNDMATLFFNSEETAIKQLFHQGGTFSAISLWIFFVLFFCLACWTYGLGIPSGLFVPSLLCGAAYGRLVANLFQNVMGYKHGYSGTYALIGAAAFLGGVVRMTISLTVILIESTNEISYGLPIMIVLMVAKWCGDLFNEGLYDLHIESKHVPVLGWDVPPYMYRLKASDVMSKRVVYIFPQTRVQTLVDILSTTRHHAFAVVSPSRYQMEPREPNRANVEQEGGVDFKGMVLRSQLVTLLQSGVYTHPSQANQQEKLTYEQLTGNYPRYPDIHDINIPVIDPDTVLDVSRYMNSSVYTIGPSTPVPQVFRLFRSMGLRHLPVINSQGQILGIISRHNLTDEHLKVCLTLHSADIELT